MKINNIRQEHKKQNFNGLADKVAKNPKLVAGIAGLAGSSVIAQKLIMSSGEATIAPMMDIGVGKTITKITGETDNRTNESSKVQAIRTVSQAIGGTIVGIVIRAACITAATYFCGKAGAKAGEGIGKILSDNGKIKPKNVYEFSENASKWGKNIGGAAATVVMFATNFIIDAPFINWINKKLTNKVKKPNNEIKQPKPQIQSKEAK